MTDSDEEVRYNFTALFAAIPANKSNAVYFIRLKIFLLPLSACGPPGDYDEVRAQVERLRQEVLDAI
ncbi:hypothetical protein [Herbidospora sp. RD11066]